MDRALQVEPRTDTATEPVTQIVRIRRAPRHEIQIGGYRPGMLAGMIGLQMQMALPAERQAVAHEVATASDIARFLSRFNPLHDLLIGAYDRDVLVGSIAVDSYLGGDGVALLRWLAVGAVDERRRLAGLLLRHALDFCRERGIASVDLAMPYSDTDLEMAIKTHGLGGPGSRATLVVPAV